MIHTRTTTAAAECLRTFLAVIEPMVPENSTVLGYENSGDYWPNLDFTDTHVNMHPALSVRWRHPDEDPDDEIYYRVRCLYRPGDELVWVRVDPVPNPHVPRLGKRPEIRRTIESCVAKRLGDLTAGELARLPTDFRHGDTHSPFDAAIEWWNATYPDTPWYSDLHVWLVTLRVV